jgi:exonuclease SbcD
MLRLAHIADSHFDEHSRFQECVKVHDWIADDIACRRVDLIVHSGDVYERKSTPTERMAVARFFQQLARVAPVVVVRGNHDVLGDLPLLERLETDHPITVVEGASAFFAGGFAVACLAWPSKAGILALGAESHAEGELLAGEALRNVLRGLGEKLRHANDAEPRILLAHAMVRGSRVSTGQPLVGCDLELGLEDLALARAHYVALGHIHKCQDWPASEAGEFAGRIVYPGSPRRTAFGELEAKGYALAEFDGQSCTGWTFVETPCAPMYLVEDEWGDDDGANGWLVGVDRHPAERPLAGAEVRFRYRVPADLREEARAAAERVDADLRAAGAIDVKVEAIVKPQGTARAPEVASAPTLAEKLLALWRARRVTPEEPRQARLLEKLADLEVKAS